jgi:membrane protein required for colicin V production
MIEFVKDSIAIFDLLVALIIIYSMVRCGAKGFVLSLFSFSKWLAALVITIVLVPKLNPWVQDYIESKFITDVGLGIFVFIISLFIVINLSKALNSVIKWSGVGSVDKSFGFVFGILKGYIVCVCIFSLLNWFYPHQKWPIETEDTYTFEIIYKGSVFLIEEFPNSKKYYEKTEEKIEKI